MFPVTQRPSLIVTEKVLLIITNTDYQFISWWSINVQLISALVEKSCCMIQIFRRLVKLFVIQHTGRIRFQVMTYW